MRIRARDVAAALLATLAVAGCASESPDNDVTTAPIGASTPTNTTSPSPTPEPTTEPPAEVTISETGFVEGESDTVAWAIVDNPTDRVIFGNIIFTAYDADDRVVGTQESWFAAIRSGQTFGIAQSVLPQEGTTVARIEARWSEDTSEPDPSPQSLFEIDSTDIFESYGSVSVTGTVTSTYEDTVEGLNVFAICTDADGDVVTAGQGSVDFPVAGGDSAPYAVEFMPLPMPAECDVWASFGLSTVYG